MVSRLILVAALVVGCKNSGEDGGKPTPPELQIVSVGSEPRQLLRYQPMKGTTQKLEVALDMEVGAGEMGGALPTFIMSISLAVDSVLPSGAQLRMTIVDVAARDRNESRVQAAALTAPLEAMKGVVITGMLLPHGRLVGAKVESNGKQLPEIVQTQLAALTTNLDEWMLPLPEQPVGVGAVWRNSKSIEQSGMKMTGVNSVQLTAINGNKLSVDIDTEIHGDDQTVKQGDLTVDVKDITGTGGGGGTIDLQTLAMTFKLGMELRSAMQATGESAPTPMTMSLVTNVTPR